MNDDKLTYGKIYGQEKNLATSAIARMNLFLHGAEDFKITQGDTLRNPNFLYRGELRTFDCVLANPPFSLRNWGSEAFAFDMYGRNIWGAPSDSSADFAWLQHMVKSMDADNGRLAVVLPQGVLFHGGKEGEIRKQLVESDKLECIITLVSGLFYSTGVSACILFLNNRKCDEHKGKICMIDASGIYTAQRAQNIMTDDDVDEVYALYTAYQDKIEKTKIVTIEDVKDKEYTLAVNSYIEKEKVEMLEPSVVRENFLKALENVRQAEQELKQLLQEGGYLDGESN
jgi:type I restriction enzyme M protein